jgi:uncharacterized membrane protein (UPF0182 family)
VSIGNLFDKVLYAVKFGDANLVLSDRVHENTKILYDRHPRRMVEKVAPWLTVDADPYPVVVDGRIQWVLDGYTVTDKFPMSERESLEDMTDDSLADDLGFQTLPTDEINYMRNSVKATVDAYDGTVTLYEWESDPISEAWGEVFPDILQPRESIPDELLEHLRYPDDLFKVQRYQFAKYHETDPKEWYDGSTRWEVPTDPEAEGFLQPPYRLFVDDTWALTSVYVPRGRANLVSFVSVNSDATDEENYGRISVLELPNERTDGPGQIANELSSDEDVREELLSFTQGGVDPVPGNLLTLPVGDGLMYVQPLYAKRADTESSFPILRFVLVSYGDEIGIGTTLREAIADVLGVAPDSTEPIVEETPEEGGGGNAPTEPEPAGSVDDQIRALLAEAEAKFAAADRAQANGNTVGWARLMEDGRKLITEAFALASARDARGS